MATRHHLQEQNVSLSRLYRLSSGWSVCYMKSWKQRQDGGKRIRGCAFMATNYHVWCQLQCIAAKICDGHIQKSTLYRTTWFAPAASMLIPQVVQVPSHAPWGLLNIIMRRLLAHASLDGYLSIYLFDKKGAATIISWSHCNTCFIERSNIAWGKASEDR